MVRERHVATTSIEVADLNSRIRWTVRRVGIGRLQQNCALHKEFLAGGGHATPSENICALARKQVNTRVRVRTHTHTHTHAHTKKTLIKERARKAQLVYNVCTIADHCHRKLFERHHRSLPHAVQSCIVVRVFEKGVFV
jgi:hypothetical protein